MKTTFILDCKNEINAFISETIDIDLPPISLPVIMDDLIEILNQDNSNDYPINRYVSWAASKYINESDAFIQYDHEAEQRLYSAMLKLATAIRNKLRHHHAYVDGQCPFTFMRFFHHGTFYLTRKREAASTIAHHPRYTGGGVRIT